jgi:UDP-glucose 4-epimerase
MKVLVTGAAGFLGSHLCTRLLNEGHYVVGVDNFLGGEINNVPSGIEFFAYDCRDFDAMKYAMQGVDVVCHAAATAHEGLSVFSPSFITKNIYEASVATMSAAIASGVKRFVFCSSMARYGNNPAPFTEDMRPEPVDPYAVAKVAAEDTLKILSQVHGMEYNIVIPHNIVGPRQCYTDPYRNVMSIMINRTLQGLPIYIYGDGEQIRCFSYVDECIDCIMPVLFNKDVVNETINIGPDTGEVTINELARLVLQEMDCDIKPIHLPSRPQEVRHANCSADKARLLLGYETKHSLQHCIRETLNWIKIDGAKPFNYFVDLEIINEKTPKTWSDKIM